jgi:NADH:ubiquinone oxidoreductase subunit D
MLRGSGVNWDLRKSFPYEIYNKLNFKAPVGKHGDCFDRYILRIEEMRQSIDIINQCINTITPGLVKVQNNKICSPSRGIVKKSMEGLIHHFKLYTEGLIVQPGELYLSVEAPKGEFGVFLVSNGSGIPYKCKIRAPGYFSLQSVNQIGLNSFIADLITILGTIDIVFGEVDR